jgi:SNW domain-containing protein 1
MHEECLQGNFSSVEILRENSLYQDDKGILSEIIGVAPPPVPPVERESNSSKKIREEEEEIRVWRQKDREKHRLLDDKDVAMGKKIKITSFIDRDISEELALVLPSTNQGSKVMYTERLFNQDKGMSKKDVYKGGFTEASERAPLRDRPVQFESEEADSSGLDRFLAEGKKGKKALENVGGGGTMRAVAGSSMRDSSDGGRGRNRIGFETGCSADQC